jgi:hypothetical protein
MDTEQDDGCLAQFEGVVKNPLKTLLLDDYDKLVSDFPVAHFVSVDVDSLEIVNIEINSTEKKMLEICGNATGRLFIYADHDTRFPLEKSGQDSRQLFTATAVRVSKYHVLTCRNIFQNSENESEFTFNAAFVVFKNDEALSSGIKPNSMHEANSDYTYELEMIDINKIDTEFPTFHRLNTVITKSMWPTRNDFVILQFKNRVPSTLKVPVAHLTAYRPNSNKWLVGYPAWGQSFHKCISVGEEEMMKVKALLPSGRKIAQPCNTRYLQRATVENRQLIRHKTQTTSGQAGSACFDVTEEGALCGIHIGGDHLGYANYLIPSDDPALLCAYFRIVVTDDYFKYCMKQGVTDLYEMNKEFLNGRGIVKTPFM